MNSNKKKDDTLGIPYGTACSQLRKSIMFDMVKQLHLEMCYKCGNPIETLREFSIEHKVPWLDSENASELFFSLDNIAFSHLKCNIASSRRSPECKNRGKNIDAPEGMLWCSGHKGFINVDMFFPSRVTKTGYNSKCSECTARRKRERRQEKKIAKDNNL